MFDITREDLIYIENIFNNNGWVLDFNDDTFKEFNVKSIGIDIQKLYKKSKWGSLKAFFLDEQQKISDKIKLLEDLLEYYRSFKLRQSMRQSYVAPPDLGYNAILQGSVDYCHELIKKCKGSVFTVDGQANVELGVSELLVDAQKYSMSDIKTATEKIWDAFERIKTFFVDAQKNIDKKRSCEMLIDLMANGNSSLKIEINNEFLLLTTIGNNYRIRHHEVTKTEIKDDEQYKYLFNRCFSLIQFAISIIEKNK